MRLGEGYCGKISLRYSPSGEKFPGEATVVGEGEIGAILVGMFVVAACDDSVEYVAESDGENASGVLAVGDGGFGDGPGFARVGGVKYAGGFSSGSEPDILVALHRDASSTGGECAFAFNGRRR